MFGEKKTSSQFPYIFATYFQPFNRRTWLTWKLECSRIVVTSGPLVLSQSLTSDWWATLPGTRSSINLHCLSMGKYRIAVPLLSEWNGPFAVVPKVAFHFSIFLYGCCFIWVFAWFSWALGCPSSLQWSARNVFSRHALLLPPHTHIQHTEMRQHRVIGNNGSQVRKACPTTNGTRQG